MYLLPVSMMTLDQMQYFMKFFVGPGLRYYGFTLFFKTPFLSPLKVPFIASDELIALASKCVIGIRTA